MWRKLTPETKSNSALRMRPSGVLQVSDNIKFLPFTKKNVIPEILWNNNKCGFFIQKKKNQNI